MLETLFWILFFIVAYTFAGYTILLRFLVFIKRIFKGKPAINELDENNLPDVCLFVTAFNEADFVAQKVANTFQLNYPKNKIQYLWLTDGSDDGTPDLLGKYPPLQVEHQPGRKGKIHAMNRGMQFVKAPIVIFSDSNTLLGENSVREIVRQFQNEKVGCVAGEKRILEQVEDTAAGSGEGLYWKIESITKQLDAELSSAVGAAGELFAVRTALFDPVDADAILDDFMISLRIAGKGYRIAYAPEAYAAESASASVKEELKRKTRISAGGIQTLFRMPEMFNPMHYGWLSFQYFSHKVLRWTLAPFALFLIFFINFLILLKQANWLPNNFYALFFYLQSFMYTIAVIGWLFENRQLRLKLFFAPYYFTAMNYASIKGIFRYLRGQQSVVWEKSKRAKV
ncbi:MAG TPA: glycosyltransferase [Sunxiuqinia sp.]|nr:glycosyltransferase [Sunxiuqinia sp.]